MTGTRRDDAGRGGVRRSGAWTLAAAGFLLALALAGAGPAEAQIRLEDPGRDLLLTITGWVQPRYEFLDRRDEEDLSSFYLRRLRLDLRGHVFTPRLTYRVMPELRGTASLRDGWLNYAFTPRLQLRFGQFSIPFQWHRYVSPRRQHFNERGVPSETFGYPAGRDLGVMLWGSAAAERLAWWVGVFDGAGINVGRSTSAGNVISARLGLAALGPLPRDEVDIIPSPRPHLAFGLGVQGATDNEVREWDLGRSPADDPRADWITGTGDVSFRWRGFSLAADGYLRRVRPDDPAVDAYTGRGYMVSTGYTLVAGFLDAVARWSELRLDRDDPLTHRREWGVGFNVYFTGHDSKTRVQYLNDRNGLSRTGMFYVEHHLQF